MRSLIARYAALALALISGPIHHAAAQDVTPTIVVSATLVGFVALGVGSTARLLERPVALVAGDSVRMVVRRGDSAASRSGRVRAVFQDSVTVQSVDTTVTIALDDMRHVRAYGGAEHKWAQGWLVGFVTGASIGAWSGYSNPGSTDGCEFLCLTPTQSAVLVGTVGAITGSLVGAGVGSLVEGAHWRSVNRLQSSTDARHVALTPVIGPRAWGARVDIPVR